MSDRVTSTTVTAASESDVAMDVDKHIPADLHDGESSSDSEDEEVSMEVKKAQVGDEIDISGDGGVKKKILRLGDGAYPRKGQRVVVHYTGTLASNGDKFDSSRDRGDPFEFTIGRSEVIKAWDQGVATMRVGEHAVLTCEAKYAYGERGSPPKIPGGATLVFDVELLEVKERERQPWEMSFEEKVEKAAGKKDEGNELFKAGNWDGSLKAYEAAAKFLEYLYGMSDNERERANALNAVLNLNQAASLLKLGRFRDAVDKCTKSLELSPNNAKALYRRAQAYMSLTEYAKSRQDYEQALTITPGDAALLAGVQLLNRTEAEYHQREKGMYKRMFAAVAGEE